ncbi:hypothetical protein [Streptomyces sp. WAC04114]|uniref:hypothetical protein n=1 Tax=Streptomyces sp. WAC04114 TaxID=2867961 RepID=UPI001C8CD79B|nr:hypothetical protein [Streptomyces sp. WAC04114]MBX9365777.1 hypothetical protein [Streptomyces sp. WAC04114]
MRMGDVETVFVNLVRRFPYEADALRRGDVVGWHDLAGSGAESDPASGDRADPGRFRPARRPGRLLPEQEVVIPDMTKGAPPHTAAEPPWSSCSRPTC